MKHDSIFRAESSDLQYDSIQKEDPPSDGITPTRTERDEQESPTAELEFQSKVCLFVFNLF